MDDKTVRRIGVCLSAAAATLSVGCAGAPPGAHRQSSPTDLAPRTSSNADRDVGSGECDVLNAPAGTRLAAHYYANGVQIYRWSGAAWTFVAPEAVLTADAAGKRKLGIHYAGPTWESVSHGKVVGTVARHCTPDSTSIPWISLTTTSAEGSGVFRRVTFIQRVHTVGGLAPATPGHVAGEEARVPYSAEYFFYKPE